MTANPTPPLLRDAPQAGPSATDPAPPGAEIFRRPRSSRPAPFLGERLTSAIGGQVEIEHLHRYFWAREWCRGKDVLDVACGEAYGTAALAQVAHTIVGLDCDLATMSRNDRDFAAANLTFVCADAVRLPFADASFDVVVSFETIEHLVQQRVFIQEISRVLRPCGVLIASSPDRDFYSAPGVQANPFHVQELDRDEFVHLLRERFDHVVTALQRPMVGSVLMPDSASAAGVPTVFERRDIDLVRRSTGLPHAVYVICVASNASQSISPTLYIDNSDLDGPPARLAEAVVAAQAAAGEAAALRTTSLAIEAERANAVAAREASQREVLEGVRLLTFQRIELDRLEATIDELRAQQRDSNRRCEDVLAQQTDRQRERDEARAQFARAESAGAELRLLLERTVDDLADARARCGHTEAERQTLREALDAAKAAPAREPAGIVTPGQLVELTAENQALGRSLTAVRRDVAASSDQLARVYSDLTLARRRLADIQSSTAWKATWPVRRLLHKLPGLARAGRLIAKATWWAFTGQLPRHLRWWAAKHNARTKTGNQAPPLTVERASSSFVLPAHARPVVCVIIPTYGKVHYTMRCLASIAQHPPKVPFEVLVAEDASGDPRIDDLRKVPNLRLIQHPRNLGFLLSCNEAARHTTAEFLMFLNNDTEVRAGWLDGLVDLLARRADAGATGSKLIYPDGRLQEAGGIIWRDGSGWNFGRGDDPDNPVYNYVREVDYSSGAALLVRTALFTQLEGFDPVYAPAYCEDSDLAFRLRAAGHKVLYQPRSLVVHHEGVSHGTDLSTGLKAHQVTNQARLRARWQGELEADHFPAGTHVMRARDRAFGAGVVLVVDHYVPQRDRDAGSRTIWAFIDALRQAGRSVKFWADNGAYSQGYTELLQDAGVEVLYGPHSGGFEQWISRNGNDLTGVLLSRPEVAEKYITLLRRHTAARLVFYGHDLHAARMRQQAAHSGDTDLALAADRMEQLERQVWRNVDVVLYPSTEEASAVALLEPDVVARPVTPYAFTHFAQPRPAPEGAKILFVAGFGHPPNEDAACWFASDILPRIRHGDIRAELDIVGSNPTARVRSLAGAHIHVRADVSDEVLQHCYNEARVAVVPLRYGAGVKMKVVEALVHGLPLVTTPIGAQGCPDLATVIPVVEAEDAFAAAVHRLLVDDELWCRTAQRQVSYAMEHYTAAGLRDSLLCASGL